MMDGPTIVDLFCGGGGFSEGFRQAGYDISRAVDVAEGAVETYGLNARDGEDVVQADLLDEVEPGDLPNDVDILIGSPPCKEFSSAKNGGNGDVQKGMELVDRFLYFVHELKPEYWVMENVPRLDDHLSNSRGEGPGEIPWLDSGECVEIPRREIYCCDDYGTPQRRRRLFSGDFPPVTVDEGTLSFDDVRSRFPNPTEEAGESGSIPDPLDEYDVEVPLDSLSDHFYNSHLTHRESKEIKVLKKDHSFYGRMSYPDDKDKPSRTVVAMNRRISRETLVMEEDAPPSDTPELTRFRKPTLRELATIQGFPISYQFTGESISQKRQRIGDAVPPTMSYRIALAIHRALEGIVIEAVPPDVKSIPPPIDYDFSDPDTTPRDRQKLSLKRSFRHHVPYDDMREFRVDLETTDEPAPNPLAEHIGEDLEHPVGFEVVLYRGYAGDVESERVSFERTLGYLRSFEEEHMDEHATVGQYFQAINEKLSEMVPDATTLQAIRSRRMENDRPLEFEILEVIASKEGSGTQGIVDRHFPRERFDSEDTINVDILDGTDLPIRVLMKMVAVHFVAHKLNHCGNWISNYPEQVYIPEALDIEPHEIPRNIECTTAGPANGCISSKFTRISKLGIGNMPQKSFDQSEHAD